MRQDRILFAFPYAGITRIRFFEYHLSPGFSTGTPHCVISLQMYMQISEISKSKEFWDEMIGKV